MGTSPLLGSVAVLLVTIGGLLYMIGARRLAGRAILSGVAVVLAVAFLRCLWASVSSSVAAIDPVPVAVLGSLLLLGLIGTAVAYLRFKRERKNRRSAESPRPFAPEPVPSLHEGAGDEINKERER